MSSHIGRPCLAAAFDALVDRVDGSDSLARPRLGVDYTNLASGFVYLDALKRHA
jgi:hypothetical protein